MSGICLMVAAAFGGAAVASARLRERRSALDVRARTGA